MDFYHFVKPREFEQFIRTRLVEELRSNVKQFYDRTADIRTFGSFPAGLYLPTSDMDLVLVSDTFMQGGNMIFGKKSSLYKFDAFLKRCNLALKQETELIPKAKVPLVKYVDRTTGLKIDVSFENAHEIQSPHQRFRMGAERHPDALVDRQGGLAAARRRRLRRRDRRPDHLVVRADQRAVGQRVRARPVRHPGDRSHRLRGVRHGARCRRGHRGAPDPPRDSRRARRVHRAAP